ELADAAQRQRPELSRRRTAGGGGPPQRSERFRGTGRSAECAGPPSDLLPARQHGGGERRWRLSASAATSAATPRSSADGHSAGSVPRRLRDQFEDREQGAGGSARRP